MLILSRKKDESVIVGGMGTFKILDVRDNRVRFGLEFPDEVLIHRAEVMKEIKDEMRLKMPSLTAEEQDAVVDLVIAEKEFEGSEKRRNDSHDAAKEAVEKLGAVSLRLGKEQWKVSATGSGCVATRE